MATYDRRSFDPAAFQLLRNEIQRKETDIEETRQALDTTLNDLALVNQKIEGIEAAEASARSRIQQKLQDLKEKSQAAWADAQKLQYVALAASVIPVSASIGIALSTGIGLASDAIYHHNDPNDAPDGSFLVTFEQVFERSKEFRAQADDAQTQWNAFSRSRDVAFAVWRGQGLPPDSLANSKPPTKVQAATDLAKAAAAFYKSAKKLIDLAAVPKPSQIQESALEQQDPELNTLLAQHQELNDKRGAMLSEIAASTSKTSALLSELSASVAADSDMRAVIPQNDADLSLWCMIAQRLRSQLFQTLYRSTVMLKRAAFYANGRQPMLNPDLSVYPDEALARARLASGAEPTQSLTGSLLEARFKAEKTKAQIAVGAIIDEIKNEQINYEARQNQRQFERIWTALKLDAPSSDPGRLFLENINNEILRQIKLRDPNAKPTDSAPFLIPIEFRAPTGLPERFVTGHVSAIH